MPEFRDTRQDESEHLEVRDGPEVDDGWRDVDRRAAALDSARAAVDEALEHPQAEAREGLNERDLAAIRAYTEPDGAYRYLNWSLREGKITDVETIAADSHELSEALSKLPSTQEIVHRKISGTVPQDVIDAYEPGATICMNGYTSASTDADLPWPPGNVRMVIKSETGRTVDQLSAVTTEEEVLFDRMTTFTVVEKVHDAEREGWTIFLRERRSSDGEPSGHAS